MNRRKIIIDVDVGVDDVNAILFCLLCGGYEIEAITTVHGNVNVDQATRNALWLVEQMGRPEIPVYRGAAFSMVGETAKGATIIHGEDGMGNTGLAQPTIERQPECAASALIRHVMAAPGEISLLMFGPYTNLGLALRAETDFAAAIKEIVMIGGRFSPRGEVNPFVTLNVGGDPEAAHIILQECNTPTTLLTQESAFQVMFTPEDLEAMASYGTVAGDIAAAVSRYYVEQQMKLQDAPGGSVPNVATAAYLLRPDLFTHRTMWADADTSDGLSRGALVTGFPSGTTVLVNRLAVGDSGDAAGKGQDYDLPLPGRKINIPTNVDAEAIKAWYFELLANSTRCED